MSGKLRLIRGGKGGVCVGSVRLTVSSEMAAPAVDAVVLEEDTWLVLSAEPAMRMPPDHPIRIFTELQNAHPLDPGTVIERQGRPLTLMAVVYDFGAEPCCRGEWVSAALSAILRICRERDLRSIMLPLFGVRHGRMLTEEVLPLIVRAIREGASGVPVEVCLQVPPGAQTEVRQLLEPLVGGPEAE